MDLGLIVIGSLLLLAVTGFFFWKDFKKTRWLYKIWLAATESSVLIVAVLWIFVVWWGMPLTYIIWVVTLPLKFLIWFVKYRRLRGTFVKGALKERPIPPPQPETLMLPAGSATVVSPDGSEVIAGEVIITHQPPARKVNIELATGMTQMTNTPFQDVQAVCQYFLAHYVNSGLSDYEYIGMGPHGNGFRIDIQLKRNKRVQFSAVAVNGVVVEVLRAVPHKKPLELPPGKS
jgi:hypothetical protein